VQAGCEARLEDNCDREGERGDTQGAAEAAPRAQVFSARTAPARTTMAITFISPKATRSAMRAQQQARQNVPW
jgi:hypothetical protein